MSVTNTNDLLLRVCGEFAEMPGLKVTLTQAQRLWGLERRACDELLRQLTDSRFLKRTRDGAYVRSSEH